MARQKRTSKVLINATRRASAIGSIDENLNLGNGLSLYEYSTLIETMRKQENAYNTALSTLDQLYHDMLETERELGDKSEHMLLGIASRYGKSSVEYGMAGGVLKNKRGKVLRGEAAAAKTAAKTIAMNGNGKKAATQV
jgi:hypothetical protein